MNYSYNVLGIKVNVVCWIGRKGLKSHVQIELVDHPQFLLLNTIDSLKGAYADKITTVVV